MMSLAIESISELISNMETHIGYFSLGIALYLTITSLISSIRTRKEVARLKRLIAKESPNYKSDLIITNDHSPLRHGFFIGVVTFFEDLAELEEKRHKKDSQRTTLVKLYLELDSILNTGKARSNTIVGLMLEDRFSSSIKGIRVLSLVTLVYLSCSYLEIIPFNVLAPIIPLLLISALMLDQYLITYRVRKGWYGRNEYESREIINYAIAHANKDDFNDEGGLKKLMDAPQLLEKKHTKSNGWSEA
tara:strand:- start:4624 stop:5364 length:741 start_codon:yes stop_codon:yes gene_type:complete